MQRLTPEQLSLAIVIAVCERKSRSKLKDRVATSIMDDCLAMLERPDLCPVIIRYKPGGFDPHDAELRKLASDTQALLSCMAPLVNAMAEIPHRPLRHRRAS